MASRSSTSAPTAPPSNTSGDVASAKVAARTIGRPSEASTSGTPPTTVAEKPSTNTQISSIDGKEPQPTMTVVEGGPTQDPAEKGNYRDGKGKGRKKTNAHCRYYATKAGCRAGDACPYLHDPARLRGEAPLASQAREENRQKNGRKRPGAPPSQENVSAGAETNQARAPVPLVDRTKIFSKPVAKAQVENPREFQLQQLRRRFSPKETTSEDETVLAFRMAPSDPDFPFEMLGLECVLHVPSAYPPAQPTLQVRNEEMGRGYQINVERGYDTIRMNAPQATLLATMNALDRQLESLLIEQKADTVKIIAHSNRSSDKHAEFGPEKSTRQSAPLNVSPPKGTSALYTAQPTASELEAAQTRRDTETRQLEARLGRVPLYHKSGDGIAYTLPIEPRRRSELPAGLRAIKTLRLFVPIRYPIEQCRIELQNVPRESATNAEIAFQRKAKENIKTTLMGHVNYLSQHLHVLATEKVQEEPIRVANKAPIDTTAVEESCEHQSSKRHQSAIDLVVDSAKPHVHVIPRPPEWSVRPRTDANGDSDTESSSDDDNDDEEYDSNAEIDHPTEQHETASMQSERGILLSFPYLELHGIELLELTVLSITVKCEPCKDNMDIKNLRHKPDTQAMQVKSESCKKCASDLSIGYRRELMHANSVKAGYLDLDGCTVVDMLPSNFVPTCSSCSTVYPAPGIVSVRGESSQTVCRECHQRMSFKIPEVKFLLVSNGAGPRESRYYCWPGTASSRPVYALLQVVPLVSVSLLYLKNENNSFFQDSVILRDSVAAIRCHDLEADHPIEHANRMICGFCSREQNYRPEDCGICHNSLIKQVGRGFWEGGKGTRDQARMSKKDPRKYKRPRANVPKGGKGVAKS
ncbi:hypothetical protein MMC25_003472 [Agyrium rufum]|nr:hypothetical protein [Agyrium rufum]